MNHDAAVELGLRLLRKKVRDMEEFLREAKGQNKFSDDGFNDTFPSLKTAVEVLHRELDSAVRELSNALGECRCGAELKPELNLHYCPGCRRLLDAK